MTTLPCPILPCSALPCSTLPSAVTTDQPRGTPAFQRCALPCLLLLATLLPALAQAQGFDKINTTVLNIQAILVTISVAVVTIAIIWSGFKMIFQGARFSDVSNVLIGGTFIGGAAAFASFIVN
jgi:type IV secretion system protein VirB2